MLNIGNRNTIGGSEKEPSTYSGDICEPDYEAMLQRERKKLEKTKSDIKAFEDMGDYYWDDNNTRGVLTGLYGAMHMQVKDVENNIDEILRMIDK